MAVDLHSQELLKILDGEKCLEGEREPTLPQQHLTGKVITTSWTPLSSSPPSNLPTSPRSPSKASLGAKWAMGLRPGQPSRSVSPATPKNPGESSGSSSTPPSSDMDVIDFLATMDDLKLRLEDMGDSTPKETFEDLVLIKCSRPLVGVQFPAGHALQATVPRRRGNQANSCKLLYRRTVEEIVGARGLRPWCGNGRDQQRPMPPLQRVRPLPTRLP